MSESVNTYKRFRWFTAVDRTPDGRKTKILEIVNNNSGDVLGVVKWYGPWRQYCFFAEAGTVWSDGCLTDIGRLIAMVRPMTKR